MGVSGLLLFYKAAFVNLEEWHELNFLSLLIYNIPNITKYQYKECVKL